MNLKPEEISSVIKEQIKNYHNKYEILEKCKKMIAKSQLL